MQVLWLYIIHPSMNDNRYDSIIIHTTVKFYIAKAGTVYGGQDHHEVRV